jgi:hypothetical protein
MPALQSSYRGNEQAVGRSPRISIVSSDRVGKETNQVNRQLTSVTRLAATALLVGIAVMACGKPNDAAGGQPAVSTPAAQQSHADQAAATLAPTPISALTDSAAAATSPASAATAADAAAGDPLDAQLSNLDNLFNGVNGSLSGSDASGGE